MKTERLTENALRGVDVLGFQLERLGVTDKVNRHNLAAFLMAQQHHLEGEWESLQTRIERARAKADQKLTRVEQSDSALLAPLASRLKRLTRFQILR
ncbi:hypothetical protein [uncultured Marinobacter sp.]|uniref:hypothetical protein n=1 Tax=uncultured Marinobacter sp. TaxID=187379 RepID=UPI0030DBDF07